jgi:hypothetical protein
MRALTRFNKGAAQVVVAKIAAVMRVVFMMLVMDSS